MLISIIIPCYNEANTIEHIVNKILSQKNINKEIILVNDGSNDGSEFIINEQLKFKVNKIINHPKNLGKGASIKSGIKYANGEIILIQDKSLIEKIAQRQFNDLEWKFAQSKPKEFLETVLGKEQSINEKIFSNINNCQNLLDDTI
jgi:glycosyltransferase involved in cell wall biosynthesis